MDASAVAARAEMVFSDQPPLMRGEVVLVRAQYAIDFTDFEEDPREVNGDVFVTNARVIFYPNNRSSLSSSLDVARDIPLGCLASVSLSTDGTFYRNGRWSQLEIIAKDVRRLKLGFDTSRHAFVDSLQQTIVGLACPADLPRGVFAAAFERDPSPPAQEIAVQRRLSAASSEALDAFWRLYDCEAEFRRMEASPNHWRISSVNAAYALCDTYPRQLVVPAGITDDELRAAAEFRTRKRFPVVSYCRGECAIVRAAQPLRGLFGKRSPEDEKLLQLMGRSMCVVDCRPRADAVGNALMGRGYEGAEYGSLEFMGIENVHVMRESYRRMLELCVLPPSFSRDTYYHSYVDKSRWLLHSALILKAARHVALQIESGTSVLVHCSDGWDRTAQVVSLAMLLLDPFYRTLRGFAVLVEKEWVAAGHQFRTRCAHGRPDFWGGHQSPVFLQFIDCVHQLVRQQPAMFEFNDALLVFLAQHLYSCWYGTFLFDSERELLESGASAFLPSVWSAIFAAAPRFTNTSFLPSEKHMSLLPFGTTPRYLHVWDELFNRWHLKALQLDFAADDSAEAERARPPDSLGAPLVRLDGAASGDETDS